MNLHKSCAKRVQEAEDAIIQTNRAIPELDNDHIQSRRKLLPIPKKEIL
jgi:hypothetical protein